MLFCRILLTLSRVKLLLESIFYQCCKSEPKLDKNRVIVHFWADISKDPKACCSQALKSFPAWPESQPKGPCLVLAVSEGNSTHCTKTKAVLDSSALNLSSSRRLEMDTQSMLRFLVHHSGDQNPLISRKLGAEWLQNELWFSSSALSGLQFGLDGAAQTMRRFFLHFLAYPCAKSLANRKLAGFMVTLRLNFTQIYPVG